MSTPKPKPKAKLIIAVMYPENNKPAELLIELKGLYGTFKYSEELEFNYTKFYETEFGNKLKKIYLAFEKDFDIETLPDIKHICFELENKYSKEHKRVFNIDPGYITKDSVVLASFKDRAHRIYLNKGVYADLQFVFENKEFKSFNWTFKDIKKIKNFLNKVKLTL